MHCLNNIIISVNEFMRLRSLMVMILSTGLMIVAWIGTLNAGIQDHDRLPLPDFLPAGNAQAVLDDDLWQKDMNHAFQMASTEYKNLLLLFTVPDCPWCRKIETESLAQADVRIRLSSFIPVSISAAQNSEIAQRLQVRGVPTIIFLAPNGIELARIDGYVPAPVLEAKMSEVLSGRVNSAYRQIIEEIVPIMKSDNLAHSDWRRLMHALQDKNYRAMVRDAIFSLDPFPAEDLIWLLKDPFLTVRLGAIEVLEEITGDDFGFDPWEPENVNSMALGKWKEWAIDSGGKIADTLYSPLSSEETDYYLHEVISPDPKRSDRALRTLKQNCRGLLDSVDQFLKTNPNLPPGLRYRLLELKYFALLSSFGQPFQEGVEHQLVFGNLDARLDAIRYLGTFKDQAAPILTDFLENNRSLIRETAVDVLINSVKQKAISTIQTHVAVEQDPEVIITIIKGLGTLRNKRSLDLLVSFLNHDNEDIVIASLRSIAKLKTRKAENDVGRTLADPRWRVRVAALECTEALELKTLTDTVSGLMYDPDTFVRFNAVRTMGRIGNEKSLPALKDVFFKYDHLKGAVISAMAALETQLPDEFATSLLNIDQVDVLFGVLDSLKTCGDHCLDVTASLAKHKNPDVACQAVRIISDKAVETPVYRRLLIQELISGSKDFVLAVLKEAILSPSERERMGLTNILNMNYGPVPDTVGNKDFIADLIEAFTGGTLKSSSQNKTYDGPGTITDFITATERCLEHPDREVQISAAILLLSFGNTRGAGILLQSLDMMTLVQRSTIADVLEGMDGKEVISLTEKLIADTSEEVREKAFASVLRNSIESDWLSFFLDQLTTSRSPIYIPEFSWGYLHEICAVPDSRSIIRAKANQILKTETREEFISFALFALSFCGQNTDLPKINSLSDSDSPWVRRAAYLTIHRISPDTFDHMVDKIIRDPSFYVRQTIPAVYRLQSSRINHFFNEQLIYKEYGYRRYASEPPELTEAALKAIRSLAKDTAPEVRFESMMLLMEYQQEIDLTSFLKAVELYPDRKEANRIVGNFVEEHYQLLSEKFKTLTSFLDYSSPDEMLKQKIYEYFNMERDEGDSSKTYLARKAVSEKHVIKGQQEIRIVFFSNPDCDICETAEDILYEIKRTFPSVKIEKHNIHTNTAIRLNDYLCDHFTVPPEARGKAPIIFAGAGFLSGTDITRPLVAELTGDSRGLPLPQGHDDAVFNPTAKSLSKDVSQKKNNMFIYVFCITFFIALITGTVILVYRRQRH